MYIQRFAYRDGVSKGAIEEAWGEGFKAVARNGNWGDVERGVTHEGTYGTAWGGYVLIEVDDPEAFGRYQAFHLQNYAHVVNHHPSSRLGTWTARSRRPDFYHLVRTFGPDDQCECRA